MLGVIPERRQPDYLRPEMSPGSDSVPDLEEAEASVFVGQDPLPALGPGEFKVGTYWILMNYPCLTLLGSWRDVPSQHQS